MKRIALGVVWIAGVTPIWGQDSLRGHWKGSVEIPDAALAVAVDLDKGSNAWIGWMSISIPAMNISGIPLEAVVFKNGKCTFRTKSGEPFAEGTFTGTLSADAKTMTGDFTSEFDRFSFKLSRTGDPHSQVEEGMVSPPVAKEFLGNWEGTLEEQEARLVLKVSNDANGAKAVLIAVNLSHLEMPASGIEQKDSRLVLVVKMLKGRYEAEINKEGSELSGTWTQGAKDLPLNFKKASNQDKKP